MNRSFHPASKDVYTVTIRMKFSSQKMKLTMKDYTGLITDQPMLRTVLLTTLCIITKVQ
jgi:hypothetical protein